MDQRAGDMFQAQAHIYKHVFNFISSMSLKCAIQLGIPDKVHSHGSPITLPDLVSALQLHPSKTSFLKRLMSVLVHSGFFNTTKVHRDLEEEQEAYVLAPSSTLLLKDNANNLSPFALALLDPVIMNPWHFLGDWMKEGGNKHLTPFETACGADFWGVLEQDPRFRTVFHDAMASDSQMMNLVVSDCKAVFEGLSSLVDVGGGTGSIARILSEAYPNLKCTVLELPHVVAGLQDSEKLKFVAGDMFQAIPSGDAVLLKLVLHAFGDEDCVKVLQKCREAIGGEGAGGKVIIIDIVIEENKDEGDLTEGRLYFDMLLRVVVSGGERSEKDWERLFLEAGFSQYKIYPILGLRSLIEVYP